MPHIKHDTHAPLTEAYLDRMKRRDDPNDASVCEHNNEIARDGCPECGPSFGGVQVSG